MAEDLTQFTLVTKDEPVIKYNFLHRILGLHKDHPLYKARFAIPERTIFECYRAVLPTEDQERLRVKILDRAGSEMSDSVFPDLPCVLFGDKKVQKNNVAVFFKKITTVNDKFRRETENMEKIKRLEVMC